MKADSQFWWNWWVSLGVAIATTSVAAIALFGDWFRARILPPKLKLSLKNTAGEKTIVRSQRQTEEGLQEWMADARYYHVRVSNQRRWPSANQVQIYLIRIEEPGPDGELQITWTGELPIEWTHQAIYPVARTIGAAASCDLCSVVKDNWIRLHPLLSPHNLTVKWPGPTQLTVSLQARGNEGESAISRFHIAWDGKWADGDSEMTRHLIVKDITEKA